MFIYPNKYNLKMTIIIFVDAFSSSQRCKRCKNAFGYITTETFQILLSFWIFLNSICNEKENFQIKIHVMDSDIQSKLENRNWSQLANFSYI